MYNITSAVTCRTLAIVRSLPLPGCDGYGPLEKGPSTLIAGVRITGVSNVKTGSQSPPLQYIGGGGGGGGFW